MSRELAVPFLSRSRLQTSIEEQLEAQAVWKMGVILLCRGVKSWSVTYDTV